MPAHCWNCEDPIDNGLLLNGILLCHPCAEDEPLEHQRDELDDPKRVAVRDRSGCIVITDPHMALLISEQS